MRIISIIHKLFFATLITIILGFFILLIWAKQGIALDEITIFNHKVSKLYIKWDKKLSITAEKIVKQSSSSDPIELPDMNLLLRLIHNGLDKLRIDSFVNQNVTTQISYENQTLHLDSDKFDLHTAFTLHKDHIQSEGFKLHLKKSDLKLEGLATVYKDDNFFTFDTLITLKNNFKAKLNVQYKKSELYLQATTDSIKDLHFIQNFFDMPPSVSPWIFTKLKAQSYTNVDLSSHFPLSDPTQFIKNLIGKVKLNALNYRFDEKLPAVEAKEALLTFKSAGLFISMNHAALKELSVMPLEVNIVTLSSAPTLEVSFHTNALLQTPLLNILKHYHVDLPLSQSEGKNSIDFALRMNLKELKPDLKASIRLDQSKIEIADFPVQIEHAHIELKDQTLRIHESALSAWQQSKISLQGSYGLKTEQGYFDLNTTNVDLLQLTLNGTLKSKLLLDQGSIRLLTEKSHWNFNEKTPIVAHAFTITLNQEKSLALSPLSFFNKDHLDLSIKGNYNLHTKRSDLTFALNKFNFTTDNNVTYLLDHPFVIKKTKPNYFQSNRSINILTSDNNVISTQKISFSLDKIRSLTFEDFRFKERFRGNLALNYDTATHQGSVDLTRIEFQTLFIQPSVIKLDKEDFHFHIDSLKNFNLTEPDLALHYSKVPAMHTLALQDVKKFYPLSPLLQKFSIVDGNATLMTPDFQSYTIQAQVNHYPLEGYINPNPDQNLTLTGTFDYTKGLSLTLNKHLTVDFNKILNVKAHDLTVDLRPFLAEKPKETKAEKKTTNTFDTTVQLIARNATLLLNDEDKLILDYLQATQEGQNFYASIKHDKGEAILLLQDKQVELFGEKFGDNFIKNLTGFGGFQGGHFNFFIKGKEDTLYGGIQLRETTAKGFALYNNILSFFNTVPALLTFQSPGFNSDGFKINKGDILFEKDKEHVDIRTIKLYGESSNIFGAGKIDLKKKRIDMTLRVFLLKDLGTVVANIPIAGYLLLGDDGSLTTTISISGDLANPSISVDLGKDLIMAPLNILKRTITLPLKFVDWLTSSPEKKDKKGF